MIKNFIALAKPDTISRLIEQEIQAKSTQHRDLQNKYFVELLQSQEPNQKVWDCHLFEAWQGSAEVSKLVSGLFGNLLNPLC